jgi:hypothetical protein
MNDPAFGATNSSFDASSVPTTTTSVFGGATPVFGASSGTTSVTPTFGTTQDFGASSTVPSGV